MSKHDETRLLLKIATLYYQEGLKQAQIAKTLRLSQSQVSRSITRCLKEGIVKINVVQPPNVFIALESHIQKTFGVSNVIVVDVEDNPSDTQVKRAIGSSGAHYLDTTLRDGDLIGISSWSDTIRSMISYLTPSKTKTDGVIQLLGGVGHNGSIQATILTQNMADILSCPAYMLPAQSIEQSVEEKDKLLATMGVSEVVSMFNKVNLAIVGIGMLEPSNLLRNSGNYFDETTLKELATRNAVGDMCLHYYNQQGEPVLENENNPVIGMTLEQLHACKHVVALAGGLDKVEAIKGALRGGYIDVLITDRVTAEAIAQ
ncbi:sugar-binding transcriptional regulator [Marinomonas mediterranea]|jgi:Transcriptional regulator, contains sigma factor-related N-terminal domain|uniref:Transcriptional regulator, DeoR family n=1 Tax=Marinomonas mediterranea (strain ATCC 700492 / JCM 21426 / NBRC 103028 / MMB-1) TaxID=717774 RepID=F2JZM8_MARM1|nr:sugar-binding transcriptional regulator [Marinomonas mediterranea]ADZ90882.1 transcriptional regulator, DeoR family [Marinomonas mediterranea MMB-1]WCN17031.1 winged helix-turn-helix transcriptional regulator [Marinomonas mediterranea MMB-1]